MLILEKVYINRDAACDSTVSPPHLHDDKLMPAGKIYIKEILWYCCMFLF
jgi:hypothetical protein